MSESMDIEPFVTDIKSSKKYKFLCEDTIRNVVSLEFSKQKSPKIALQFAKKKLHLILASYLNELNYPSAETDLKSAFSSGDNDNIKNACLQIMKKHASTKERIEILPGFYPRLFQITGIPNSITDLACALNPFSFRWMGLPNSTKYSAFDNNSQTVDLLNLYFKLENMEPLAELRDVLLNPPDSPADLTLLLKMFHCLEHRQKGSGWEIIEKTPFSWLAISFPTRNLANRKTDIFSNYMSDLYSKIEKNNWSKEIIEFNNELVLLINKNKKDTLFEKSLAKASAKGNDNKPSLIHESQFSDSLDGPKGLNRLGAPSPLYIISTPIGNLDDLSYRAVKILGSVDVLACEDTRMTRKIYTRYEIPVPKIFFAYHEHNEIAAGRKILNLLKEGKHVALCTDSGTPGVSDPGYRIISEAIASGYNVDIIPGPTAVTTAILASGLPSSSFTFKGFPPRKPGQRKKFLEMEKELPHTLVFFESPHRVATLLADALDVFGNRLAAVCIDLTKRFAEIKKGFLEELSHEFAGKEIKGEVTVVIAGNNPKFMNNDE